MTYLKKNIRLPLIVISLFVFIIGFFIKLNIPTSSAYKNIYFLPIAFAFFLYGIVGFYAKLKNYFVFWILTTQQILRYVIAPLLLVIEGKSRYGNNTSNADYAITMMLIELLAMFFAYKLIKQKKSNIARIHFLKINFINVALLGTFVALLLSDNNFINKLNFVWNINAYIKERSAGEIEKTSPLLTITFPIIRAYIILFIFSLIHKLRVRPGFKVALSFFIILLNATLIIGVSRFSIIYASFPLVLLMIFLYPNYKRKVILTSSIFFLATLLIASIGKFSRNNKTAEVNTFFSFYQINAYFSGVANYAIGYDSYEKSNVTDLADHFYYLSSDLTQNIPVISALSSDQYKSNIKFNNEIYGSFMTRDQIVPISIAGLYHFGFYLFFIHMFLISLLAFKFENKAYTAKDVLLFFVYIILAVGCSTWMMINIGSLSATLFVYSIFYIPLFNFTNRLNRIQRT
ncbi:O-antigen polymerase [Niabella drilacis]|uniref:Oligosaccharide repeat unit polymerase n=1 Tax=Niabella drilacis (strain DSM 25811 / CCM 8410 / CCUG 62505 / LMG 26954 / E90) TaxID=1285928 RepID=A0A1G6QVE8_NIADE|nr:O-antigen polymerase [Niabella drilacis]SDC95904.1 hypothetical protein SAMN04487894_10522 [Niabella drilacis]